jgi:membrane protease YdiL (CAAX protease family)
MQTEADTGFNRRALASDRAQRLNTPSAIILEIVLVFALAIAAMVIVGGLLGNGLVAQQLAAVTGVGVMLGLVWLGLRLRGERWLRFGLRFGWPGVKPAMMVVLKSLPVFILATLAFVLSGSLLAKMLDSTQQGDFSGFAFLAGRPWLLVGTIITAWITASFSEEVLYRGFLLSRIEDLFSGARAATWAAALGSSALFGLAHFTWGPVGMVQTFAMGLVLALGFLKFGRNLWVTILAHAYMDTLLFVSVYASLSNDQ